MRNRISEAINGQERQGIDRLRDTGRLGYRAASIQADPVDNSLSQAFRNFGETAMRAYGTYKEVQQSRADERSNEIIRKLSPEQRREAIANGTLLYQDDPEAMRALRFKSGRNAAFEVETEIRNKIEQGAFKTSQELSEYRRTRLEDKAKAYAEASGIDYADEHYQRGFNADIVSREAAIFDLHQQKLSQQTQAIAKMEATSDAGSMLSDERFLRSPNGPADFANYITANLASGSIPTEAMAIDVLSKALADNSAQPGADVFMDRIGDQEILLYGRPMKIRDIMGAEVLENYRVKSGEAQFKRNRDLAQQFAFGLQNATAQADPTEGLRMLEGLQTELFKRQPTDAVTTQSEQINAARGHLLARIQQDSAKRLELMNKQVQEDNQMTLFDSKYQQRISGDNVSTDWRTFETNESTGKITRESAANYAIQKLSDIDRMAISDADKDKMRLQYLKADYKDGPFQQHFQTLTQDAVNQYNGLVTAESAEVNEETTARIREFQRIYRSDPATIASLYPEQAVLAERLDLMERNSIDLSVMVDADRRKKGLTKEEQIIQDRKWATLYTGSDSAVPYLPGPLRDAARTLYESELFRTGDEGMAKGVVNNWLEKSTVSFTSDNGRGVDLGVGGRWGGNESRTVGAVQKRTLMVDPQDSSSWTEGREIINETIRELAKSKPWLNEGDITINETPLGIVLKDSLGSINMPPITTGILRQEYERKRQEALAKSLADKDKRATEVIDKFKNEQQRRKAISPAPLDPSFGTLEGAAGFRDNQ